MFLQNAALLCIGLAAGALLSSPRRSVSALRASVGSLERESASAASRGLNHSQRIKWLEDARDSAEQQRNEQVALLLGRLDGQDLRLKAAEQARSTLAADMLQLGSEVNGRLDTLEGIAGSLDDRFSEDVALISLLEERMNERLTALERRISELANQDALVETIDRQLRDMQQFIVEAAERAQQQQQQQPVPTPLPSQLTQAPGVQTIGVNSAFQATSADSIAGILELQRQAQQAFVARRQPQPPMAGLEGAGL